MKNFRFLFTEWGFYPDYSRGTEERYWKTLREEFEQDAYLALYNLGFHEKPKNFDASGLFLCQLVDSFLQELSARSDIELARENVKIEIDEVRLERLLDSIPFTIGSEYVTEAWIEEQFRGLNKVFSREISDYKGTVSMYLSGKSQQLHIPERIFFHLVENKGDFPFAFMATYATRNRDNNICHMPLKYALVEYDTDREKLVELLSCLNRVAEGSKLIREFVENGELFHPLQLTAEEAYCLLKDVPIIEESGIICRIPNWWRRQDVGVSLSINLGEEKSAYVGMNTVLNMQPQLTVDGVILEGEEIQRLLLQTEGLAFLKGKWVEVNHEKLSQLLKQMDEFSGTVTLVDALRIGIMGDEKKQKIDVGPLVANGKWMTNLLSDLKNLGNIRNLQVPKTVKAVLRPYQLNGYKWLNYMKKLGFGACLADDMGLGKTLQVLTFLEKMRTENKKARVLLVVPASLLGNWQKEVEKFVPSMSVVVLHGIVTKDIGAAIQNSPVFLTITTYGMVSRIKEKELENVNWDCLILDEAQAIKNPATQQTKRVKKIKSKMKIAMTGTPIENDLTNLWSLFDFLNKGLLGSSAEFRKFCKELREKPEGYARLKGMISPFMLRRLKTDKAIISDLPEKLERISYVNVSKKQAVLYRKYVEDLIGRLENSDNGLGRKGLILASLTKLKQICNHPDQYLGQESYMVSDSGKFEILRDICTVIAEKRERVLVFTQFKEIIPYLDTFLQGIFGTKGYTLHGGTPIAQRSRIVGEFQSNEYIPYIILSVKAGGTGLNLTNASHVIHFDRWWNPAVENQATDRSYRIGQKKNVVVHKLVCKGTIEEKIDDMINTKKELEENVIGSVGENWITEMSNEELVSMMRLEV